MGYHTRFHLYDKYGSHIAYQIHILCSYQSPREKSRLIEFDSPYKIIEELPSFVNSGIDVPAVTE